jgi:hypothetical protein
LNSQRLELLEPVFGVEELAPVGHMRPQGSDSAGPTPSAGCRPEAAAIEPDVEQPVVFVVRFFRGGIEQELAGRFVPLDADFGLERPELVPL